MSKSLSKIWLDEFLVPGKFVAICGLCEQSGILTTKVGRKFYCICPNGRTIKRMNSKSLRIELGKNNEQNGG